MADINTAAIEAQLQADPAVRQAAQAILDYHARTGVWMEGHGASPNANRLASATAQYVPDGYAAVMQADGSFKVAKKSIIPKLITAAAILVMSGGVAYGLTGPSVAAGAGGGTAAGGAAGGGATAAGTGASASTIGGLTGTGTTAGTVAGGTTAGTTAAGTTAAASPGAFSQFARFLTRPDVIGAATQLGGAYLSSRSNDQATAAQTQAAREALDVQTQLYNTNTGLNVGQYNQQTGIQVGQANQNSHAYNTTLANLQPYRQAGAASLSMLGAGLGLPGYMGGEQTVLNQPPPSQPVAPISITPLAVPPPIQMPGTTPAASVPDRTGGTAVPRTGTTTAPQVGERRMVNGQLAQWDSKGWKAVGS